MKIVLKGERPWSWNKIYSGAHWSVRATEADRVHSLIREQVKGYKILDGPVDIVITVYFRNRPLDCTNIPAKLYEDGLKGLVIRDDTPQYVRSVTTKSRTDILFPRVEIEITYATE